ncbi:MAG: hypothetical protein AB1423_14255 [Pseudomonadota bacterium]
MQAFSQRPAENTDYFPGCVALDEDNERYGWVVIPELLTSSVTMTDFVHNEGMSLIQTVRKIVSEVLYSGKWLLVVAFYAQHCNVLHDADSR